MAASAVELRNSPAIFVGSNEWAYKNLPALRFQSARDAGTNAQWITDRQNPAAKIWGVTTNQKYDDYTIDYAIITRVRNPATGQMILMIDSTGTHAIAAAGEFITDPSYMNAVAPANSPEWQKQNLQIILSTKVAGESWGSPQLLAKYFW